MPPEVEIVGMVVGVVGLVVLGIGVLVVGGKMALSRDKLEIEGKNGKEEK